MDILVCPITKGNLVQIGDELWSKQAGLAFPINNGIPVMLESEARTLTEEELDSLKKR
jgi:uncharacterized protein YbaR (Trm112 family)